VDKRKKDRIQTEKNRKSGIFWRERINERRLRVALICEGMVMQNSSSKIISVTLKIQDIQNDPFFFPIPGETPSADEIRDLIYGKFKTGHGKIEISAEKEYITIQWRPEYIDVNAENLHSAAVNLAKHRQFETAISKWIQAIAINNKDVEYHYHLGLVYYELKKFQESIQSLQSVCSICPIHYKAHLALGINFIKTKDFDQAVHHLSMSARLYNNNTLAYLNLGAVYSFKKRFNDATEMFNKTIQLSPKESRAYLGLARIYTQLNDAEAANSYFKKVVELVPNSPSAELAKKSMIQTRPENVVRHSSDNKIENLSKGVAYYLSCKYALAAEHYQAYTHVQPSDDYAWYLLGETSLRLNKTDESVDCFRKAIRINSKRGLYYKALGISFYLIQKYEESIENLKKAIELGKNDPLTITLYATNLVRVHRDGDAIQQFRFALRKNPNNPMAMYHYAFTLIQHDEKQKAVELLEKINTLEYFAPIKEQSKKLLNSLR
jgi:tetratricopeptide (TPR) repeat protein